MSEEDLNLDLNIGDFEDSSTATPEEGAKLIGDIKDELGMFQMSGVNGIGSDLSPITDERVKSHIRGTSIAHALDLRDLALERGVEIDKLTQGLIDQALARYISGELSFEEDSNPLRGTGSFITLRKAIDALREKQSEPDKTSI